MDKSRAVPTIHSSPPEDKEPEALKAEKTNRVAFRKRETTRICLHHAAQEVPDVTQQLDCPEETTRNEKPVMISRGTQTRKFKPKFKRPPHRSRGIQTIVEETTEPSVPIKKKEIEYSPK